MYGMDATGWAWMILWSAALFLLLFLLIRTPSGRSASEDAMDILRARFARGELSEEEFERARDALRADQTRLPR